MDDLEGGDVNEEELEALDEKLEIDYQIGEDLKERVRPICPVARVRQATANQMSSRRLFPELSISSLARLSSTRVKTTLTRMISTRMTSLTRMYVTPKIPVYARLLIAGCISHSRTRRTRTTVGPPRLLPPHRILRNASSNKLRYCFRIKLMVHSLGFL
jgi:hypothetical protein